MKYEEALAWLYSAQERGVKLGLDRVRNFLEALGWRQGEQRFIHVAGTNGKGSVCAMLESVCRAAGYRTGLFTSPHLVTFRERIRVNGAMLEAARFELELTRIREVCEGKGIEPTFFEIVTALALMIFQGENLDAVMLETGLGGRLDATNVVRPEAAVITSIGLDHMDLLGGTLAEIAREKAGIIKPGAPVVTGPLPVEAAEVVAEVARERNAPFIAVHQPEDRWPLGLAGAHQRMNAALTLRALEAGGFAIPEKAAETGLRNVSWPGRFQRGGSRFILDGAHNPDAARQLVGTWREEFGAARTVVILGILRDKDARGICAELAGIAESFIAVPVRSPRARDLEELREVAGEFRPCRICETLREALKTTHAIAEPVLITGSLFLIGEALALLGLAEGELESSSAQ